MRPDVLVVGLGPAGASAARVLAAAGYSVLAVEKRRVVGVPVQCAEFLSAVLSVAAVSWDAVSWQLISRMVTIAESDAPQVTEDFRGRMLSRLRFDQALARAAAEQGVRCLCGTSLTNVATDGTVRLSDGLEVKPRILIGADGPQSRVGAAVAQRNREFVATRQITVPLRRPHDATDIFLRAAYRGGYGWLFPKQSSANLGVGVEYACRHQLQPLLRDLHAELAAAGRVSPAAALGVTGGLIPVGGRLRAHGALGSVPVLLAGDAAGLTNPVTGAGIEAAVRSGELAGAATAGWLEGRVGELADYEEELASLYDVAYARALRHRRALLARHAEGRAVCAATLGRAWISSPDYWLNAAE